MEQRRLRLGDIVDDYCPRERRLSNHLVVAMIGDEVKQTRCTTCEAEHAFKHGKVPARRKRAEAPPSAEAPPAAVAAKRAEPEPAAADAEAAVPARPDPVRPDPVLRVSRSKAAADPPAPPPPAMDPPEAEPLAASSDTPDDGPFHRRLIRATLPRREGDVPTRPLPDFTLRLPGARVGPFRNGDNRNSQRQFQGNWVGQPGNKPNRGPGKDRSGHQKGNRPGAFANTTNGGRNHHGRTGNKKRSR